MTSERTNLELPHPALRKRNKGFEETHQEIIEAAIGLISQQGASALSISAVARAAGINRATFYYHFASRDALLAAVKAWSSSQLAAAFTPHSGAGTAIGDRMDFITGFVLKHPELIKLWIEDFVSPGDIRASYPQWDALVAGMAAKFTAEFPDEQPDAEVYCVILLSSAIIGPRVFANRVGADLSQATIIERFRREQERILRHEAII